MLEKFRRWSRLGCDEPIPAPRERLDEPRRPQAPIPRRLTFDPGLQTDPTFSPDGHSIAYASNKSGNFDIWMQPAGGGNPVQVTSHPAQDWQPDWSPVDSRIVFRSERDGGGLFVVPATGRREERLTTIGYKPRWSPDGSRVLFVESALLGAARGRVYTTRFDGSPPQVVDTRGLSSQERDQGSLGWHPDGQRVAFLFAGFAGISLQVGTVDVTRGTTLRSEVHPRVQEGFRSQAIFPFSPEPLVWAPDATALFFLAYSRGLLNVWSVDVDPRTLAITGGPHRITMMPQMNESIVLSRTGAAIAFAAADRTPRIASYPLDARGTRIAGRPELLTPSELFASSPDLTLSGSRLLFRAGRRASGTDRGPELRIIGDAPEWKGPVDDVLGRQEVRSGPRWSPDGTRIAYRHIRQERLGPSSEAVVVTSLVVLDVETGRESRLTTPFSESKYGTETTSGWSPDGRFVVSSSGRYKPGHRAIALVPVSAAPKGETQAQKETTSRLAVMPSNGGAWTWLTDAGTWVDKPKWSTNGRLIYFISRHGGMFNVWAVGFDPDRGTAVGEPFQVTRVDGSGEHVPPDVGNVQLALGGGRLAIPIINPTEGIWMLEKFRP